MPRPSDNGEPMIVMGRISGLYGVKGWVRVYSYTVPRSGILEYDPWHVRRNGDWERRRLLEGRAHGSGVLARLEGVVDRDLASVLVGSEIAVSRGQLPSTAPGEYYWTDLLDLEVRALDGRVLGKVDSLIATGANDVLVVQGERERLIPFVMGQVIRDVDLDARKITVDWDPEF